MAGIYLEGWPHVKVEGCVFDGNYCALSVWGGYTQERWVKTATEDYEEEDVGFTTVRSCACKLIHTVLLFIHSYYTQSDSHSRMALRRVTCFERDLYGRKGK